MLTEPIGGRGMSAEIKAVRERCSAISMARLAAVLMFLASLCGTTTALAEVQGSRINPKPWAEVGARCRFESVDLHFCFGDPQAQHLIIFVHGLTGDPKQTWFNEQSRFYFPEAIAGDLGDSYVVSFGYHTILSSGPNISRIAQSLSGLIKKLRETNKYRTLRFVAHSMGGIIAREYILHFHEDQNPGLDVTHLLCLATPNNGALLAELGSWISASEQILELRAVDSDNKYLYALNEEWNNKFKAADHDGFILLAAGYEKLAKPIIGTVVPLTSSIVYADRYIGFDRDHSNIVKPVDGNDPVYVWAKARLLESIEIAALKHVEGLIKNGVIHRAATVGLLPRFKQIFRDLGDVSSTELEDIKTLARENKISDALALLEERKREQEESLRKFAETRFVEGHLRELMLQQSEADASYAEAVRLAPREMQFRVGYAYYLLTVGKATVAIAHLEQGILLATQSETRGKSRELVAMHMLAGDLRYNSGEYRKALRHYDEMTRISEEAKDPTGSAMGRLFSGRSQKILGNLASAVDLFESAARGFATTGDPAFQKRSLEQLADLHRLRGAYDRADALNDEIERLSRLVEEAERRGALPRAELTAAINLDDLRRAEAMHSEVVRTIREIWKEAEKGSGPRLFGPLQDRQLERFAATRYYEEAVKVSRKMGYVAQEADDLFELGEALEGLRPPGPAKAAEIDKGRPLSVQHFEAARRLYEQMGYRAGEAHAVDKIGLAFALSENCENAIQYFSNARSIYAEIGDSFAEAQAAANSANCFMKMKKYEQALDENEHAINLFGKLEYLPTLSQALVNQAVTFGMFGRKKEAVAAARRAEEIYVRQINRAFPHEDLLSELEKLDDP